MLLRERPERQIVRDHRDFSVDFVAQGVARVEAVHAERTVSDRRTCALHIARNVAARTEPVGHSVRRRASRALHRVP